MSQKYICACADVTKFYYRTCIYYCNITHVCVKKIMSLLTNFFIVSVYFISATNKGVVDLVMPSKLLCPDLCDTDTSALLSTMVGTTSIKLYVETICHYFANLKL